MPIVIKKGGGAQRSAPVVAGALKPVEPPPHKQLDPRECPYCHWRDGQKCDRTTHKACFRGTYLVRKPFGSR
jgi:hypothetical protein